MSAIFCFFYLDRLRVKWRRLIQIAVCRTYPGFLSLIPLLTEGIYSSGLKMYLVESKGGAIACMLLSLSFLGTWPAIMTLLERRGRLPQHTYLDYTITNLLAAVIIALTFGQIGSSTAEVPNFLTQLSQVTSHIWRTNLCSFPLSLQEKWCNIWNDLISVSCNYLCKTY